MIEFDDVGMFYFFEDRNLSISSLCIRIVLEGLEYFFECIDLGGSVNG